MPTYDAGTARAIYALDMSLFEAEIARVKTPNPADDGETVGPPPDAGGADEDR